MKNRLHSFCVIATLIAILFSANSATSQCNTNAPVVYTISGVSDIYKITPNPLWKGGDTIKIVAGNYTDVIEFDHLHGDPCRPITIINSGGLVSTATMRFKADCEYVHVTGTGDPKTTYGFKCLAGPLGGDRGQHLEFDHIEITNPNNGVGISFKTIQDTTVAGSFYVAGANNYLSTNLHFHHIYIHNTLGEGMYIGPSDPDGGNEGDYANGKPIIPLRLDSVEIDHCILDSTGWDGIQLSNARYGARIHDNTVTHFGLINEGSQQAGIILGGNTEGAVYNNTVKDGTGNGIQLFGFGQQLVYGNTLDSVGIDYLIAGISVNDVSKVGQASLFSHDYINHVETDSPMTVIAYNNQFSHPQKIGAIYVDNEENNSLPSNIHDNKFCIPGAAANWQSIYLMLKVAGSSNVNNILSCGTATFAPIANAGMDTTITLPANSITLRGSGTETNGVIASYKWIKASGPTAGTITSATSATTTVTGLTAGVYKFALTVTDTSKVTATDTVQATVNAAPAIPVISSAATASGTVGTAFSYSIIASNSPNSYTATGLPSGLNVNALTGVISGTPATAGTFNVTIGASNAGGAVTKALTITISAAIISKPVISSATSVSGTVNSSFSYSIIASNSPASYAAVGLPTGLSVNVSTGIISGTPTTAATSTVTISAKNAGGTGTATLSIKINPLAPVISSAATASDTAGIVFSYTIIASNTPASYAAAGLPTGLTVNTLSGVISGTPTTAGTYNATISATNAGGTGSKALVLTIKAQSSSNSTGSTISLYEPFETGLPTSGSSTVKNYTLVSGVWTILQGASTSTKHGGSLGLKLSGGTVTAPTYAEAPGVNAVSSVSFWAKASSTTTYTIQKSVNGGAFITVAAQTVTTTYTLYTIAVNETGSNVRIRFENTTDKTEYIDDVTITGSSIVLAARAAEPDQYENITLMPNPVTQGHLTVTVPGWDGEVAINIIDFQGRLIQKSTGVIEESKVDLLLSNLSKGAYILQLQNQGKIITKKFLVN